MRASLKRRSDGKYKIWIGFWFEMTSFSRTVLAVTCWFFLLLASIATASVTIGGLTYSIKSVSVRSSIGPEVMETNADGEFLVIRITISNVGKDAAAISDSDFHLKAGDTSFDTSSAGMMSGGFFLSKLNPGVSKTGNLIFDVPAHTSPSKYRLIVYGNGSGDRKEIPL